jgi:two-component system phosphate regulon response regulator PhoB
VRIALGTSFELEWADSIYRAKMMIAQNDYDLILLDVVLPDGDGFQLGSVLQAEDQTKHIPIIFLTGKNSLSDKILGFSVGADDYVVKPFEPLELRARVESKFRKKMQEKLEAEILRLGKLEINKDTQKVYIIDNNEKSEVDLTPIEFKLLLFLTKEKDKVYTRDEILNGVWGENIHVFSRSVDTHVSKLRKKLGPKSNYIKSVHGSGYRFSVEEEKVKIKDHQLLPH